MLKLNVGSYTLDKKYEPEEQKKFERVLFLYDNYYTPRDSDLAEHVHNTLIKLGFMIMARDYLEESIMGRQIPTHYHLSTFIFNTKAFLDGVANVLNHFYKLPFNGGDIDLKKEKFGSVLRTKSTNLANEISNQKQWICDVVFWRDELIHRKSPLIVYYSPPNDSGNAPRDTTVRMQMEPITMFNSELDIARLKKKYGHIEQDILPFCDLWINNAKRFFEKLCDNLTNDYNTYGKLTF